jgi:hypothetical protein
MSSHFEEDLKIYVIAWYLFRFEYKILRLNSGNVSQLNIHYNNLKIARVGPILHQIKKQIDPSQMLLNSSSCMKFIILTKGGWGMGVETTSLQKKRENMTNQKVPIVLQADT